MKETKEMSRCAVQRNCSWMRPPDSGKCRSKRNPDQHHDSEPPKNHGERSPTLHLADASDADGRESQYPDGEDVKRRQQASQHRMRSAVNEISRVGRNRILESKSVAA